jgi:hypothetical protein
MWSPSCHRAGLQSLVEPDMLVARCYRTRVKALETLWERLDSPHPEIRRMRKSVWRSACSIGLSQVRIGTSYRYIKDSHRHPPGLHASISIHICAEYLDQETGEWRPNLACFITRIAEHPERLQNVYFNYVMMLRALTKAAPYLRDFDYDTGDKAVDAETRSLVDGLLDQAESCQATFDETSMFSGPEAEVRLTVSPVQSHSLAR